MVICLTNFPYYKLHAKDKLKLEERREAILVGLLLFKDCVSMSLAMILLHVLMYASSQFNLALLVYPL